MKLGLIGYGAIGSEIYGALEKLGEADQLCGTLVRPGRSAPKALHSLDALIQSSPDIVMECAGHSAVEEYGAALLEAGIDLLVSSVGCLADPAISERLITAAEQGNSQLLLPSGAIAGLDGLVAAQLAGIDRVCYTSYKPPHAWRGTPAETLLDLDHKTEEEVFFEGSARDAARGYPKNANVAVAVALVSLGLDDTDARLVSSNRVADPLGVIEAEGAFGHFRFEILGLASPDNPKTSLLTAYSLLQCARLGNGLPIRQLVSR